MPFFALCLLPPYLPASLTQNCRHQCHDDFSWLSCPPSSPLPWCACAPLVPDVVALTSLGPWSESLECLYTAFPQSPRRVYTVLFSSWLSQCGLPSGHRQLLSLCPSTAGKRTSGRGRIRQWSAVCLLYSVLRDLQILSEDLLYTCVFQGDLPSESQGHIHRRQPPELRFVLPAGRCEHRCWTHPSPGQEKSQAPLLVCNINICPSCWCGVYRVQIPAFGSSLRTLMVHHILPHDAVPSCTGRNPEHGRRFFFKRSAGIEKIYLRQIST